MKMSIDKAILRVQHSSMNIDDKETADFIINTMRKYQKIKQIYIDSRYDCECYNSYEAIVEVLKNEEIDD